MPGHTTTSSIIDLGIFKHAITSPTSTNPGLGRQSTFVNVGGNGDCGFRSVAAGFIDNCLSHQHMDADLLHNILTAHFKYFPTHGVKSGKLQEQIQRLIAEVPLSELLKSLAYTLRQIAVDELCQNPALYRGAFVGNTDEGTSLEMMRKAFTWIDESAIAALANALKMPIDVKFMNRTDDIPRTLSFEYNQRAINPKVVIQLQGKHYIPQVRHKDYFTGVKAGLSSELKPVVDLNVQRDPSLTEILAKIEIDDKRTLATFENEKSRLMFMVYKARPAERLTKDDLIAIYVKGLARKSDYLEGRVSTKHGSEAFFAAITAAQTGKKVDTLPPEDYEGQFINELVHAIARARSINQMSEEDVYETANTASHKGPVS